MAEPSVFIVIVNWNGWKDTIECLDSLLKNCYRNYQVIVIDNLSEDESYERLSGWCKDKNSVTILQTEENLGFAGGCNIGIKYALERDADYILLLNNDTIVDKNFLINLVSTADIERNVGILGGKILHSPDNNIWYCGGKMSWLRGGGYHPYKGRTDKHAADSPPFEVDFITGCMMLIKREVFEKIGLLDESYFLYNEDADFCLQASKAGIGLKVVPDSVIYHKERSTLGGWKPYHIYYLMRNKLHFVHTFAPTRLIRWRFYLVVGLVGCALSFRWLLECRFDLIAAYWFSVAAFVRGEKGHMEQFD